MFDVEDYQEKNKTNVLNVAFSKVAFFFAILLMIAATLVAVQKEQNKSETNNIVITGSMTFQLTWDNDLDADVDLWVKGPIGGAVGFSNKGNEILNLVRDDLGKASDITNTNLELNFSRGIPEGEYIVNAHLYNKKSASLPIKVILQVWCSPPGSTEKSGNNLYNTQGILESDGQDLTLLRFRMKGGCNMDRTTINRIPYDIRAKKVGAMTWN